MLATQGSRSPKRSFGLTRLLARLLTILARPGDPDFSAAYVRARGW
jgi:hypothetical protein